MKKVAVFYAIMLGLGLTLGSFWVLQGFSQATVAEKPSLSASLAPARRHAPVVVSAAQLTELINRPLDEIFVYAYAGNSFGQIPFQIDERDADGMYVVAEDGQLDENDELIFMGADAGDWMEEPVLETGSARLRPVYVITVTDPLSDTQAWAYVFRSPDLTRTFSADYVSYDAANDRIVSPGRYALGFSTTHEFLNYLTLGDSDVNLLDRSKLRITATVTGFPMFPFSVKEDDITKDGVQAIDGPVRVTRVATSSIMGLYNPIQGTSALFAYPSLVVQPGQVIVPGAPVNVSRFRASVDWNAHATGMIHYDANNPAGVTIDGIPDAVILQPPSRWIQTSGITGTVIEVIEIPPALGGDQATYYQDDATVTAGDTGDQRSFGDAGLQVDDPVPGTYTLLRHTYFLTQATANIGSRFVDYYDFPLQVTANPYIYSVEAFLPLVLK